MNPRTDHYTFLGVPMDATPDAIAAAVDRMSGHANALAATSPAEAEVIREKLRKTRDDLLTGSQRRKGYDLWLMSVRAEQRPRSDDTTVSPLAGIATPHEVPGYTAVMPEQHTALPSPVPSSRNRWLIPLAIIVALLVGAAVALAASKVLGGGGSVATSATATKAPTAGVAPTSTVRPAVNPTSVPVIAPTSWAVTSPTSAAGVTSTVPAPAVDAVSLDRSTIGKQGYTPNGRDAQTTDGHGGTLYAWSATCTGSADGHCQKVFFFDGTRYLGTDTLNVSPSVNSVESAGPATIAITYANYAPSDPLCCPSGSPERITYHWTGTRLIPSGVPPGHKP